MHCEDRTEPEPLEQPILLLPAGLADALVCREEFVGGRHDTAYGMGLQFADRLGQGVLLADGCHVEAG